MTALSELRAKKALAESGLNANVYLQPVSSVTNEVWMTESHVIRVNRQPDQRLRREAKLARFLPAGVGYPPIVAHGGDLGADWLILERVEGEPLSRAWPTMCPEARRLATADLARRLRLVHQTPCPDLPELHQSPQLLDRAYSGHLATQRLCDALGRAGRLEFVDMGMMRELERIVLNTADCLDPFDDLTLLHGDLTFENILWDGRQVTALLDFEWARQGPSDLDLDVLLRFIAYPELHVAEDYESQTHSEDYADVPWWLAADYPELFQRSRAFDRLTIFSIASDVQELLRFPPKSPVHNIHEHHPYQRLLRTLRRTSHLDAMRDGTGTTGTPQEIRLAPREAAAAAVGEEPG